MHVHATSWPGTWSGYHGLLLGHCLALRWSTARALGTAVRAQAFYHNLLGCSLLLRCLATHALATAGRVRVCNYRALPCYSCLLLLSA